MITEDYVNFEIAKLLKEKGFDWPCLNRYVMGVFVENKHLEVQGYYINGKTEEEIVSAPTLQMAMKWLREVHNLFIDIYYDVDIKEYMYSIIKLIKGNILSVSDLANNTYEYACETAIKYCLENLI